MTDITPSTVAPQLAETAPRQTWTTPRVRALAASNAELGAAGNVDAEGHS